MTDTAPLLSVRNLQTRFRTDGGEVHAVDGVSFDIRPGQTVALVGESGCGKSVTSLSIMRLLPARAARIAGGEILLNGENLATATEQRMRRVRGNDISMIFQEPMTSLNPVLTIGRQIAETLELHEGLTRREAGEKAIHLLASVQIPEPKRRAAEYPHELSGGMRQRVMIAIAIACSPKLLIADEPTTALDVTIQAQILDLLADLKERTNMAMLFITHDLGVVAEIADHVVVMYAGRKIEEAPVADLYARPRHPYTAGLFGALPVLGSSAGGQTDRLNEIPGSVPSLRSPASHCTFAPRCPRSTDLCRAEVPPLAGQGAGHLAACFHPEPDQKGGTA
ncbi:ABC transporter ATP-binding protein [Primorskyibacter flagellatus]|uniref:ABC transporter ATP-binding protein n=1 Tax=Primorskyibacter flagellatus TaxID=1387277 RepID=A0A917AF07_9RHOB|nr:ABC transporter ATP-binding protein [Primorskyibacter flagellatus]GGE46938.1 ABC transporter ATP-binding protein [Primorskyibacter flagellatus]